MSMVSMETVVRALQHADYFRRSPWPIGGPGGHKEWWHFCVYGPDIDTLINFSVVDDVRPGAARGTEYARITMMVREDGWDGDVDVHAPDAVTIRAGGTFAAFGDNEARFDRGVYRVRASLAERAISADLELTPITMPSLANNIQLDPGPPINWLVVPRLSARGVVTIDGRRHELQDALAYHDHNWGHFSWGRNFAWEWGFGLPGDSRNPWSLVFVRLSDRGHTRAFMQALFLWHGRTQHRVLRDDGVSIAHRGFLRPNRVFKIPRVMALVSPWGTTDVPAELDIAARGDGDVVECRFIGIDVAQVIVPNDHDLGVTIIHEVSGTLSVDGEVGGQRVQMAGRAIFEFLGA